MTIISIFQALPDQNLDNLARVCRTFSLATLKNIFPPASHFSKSGSGSGVNPSAYVAEYIGNTENTTFDYGNTFCTIYFADRVLSPVVDALVPMRAETQQNVARITLKTFCEAWLEHIRGRRIKFRYIYLFLINKLTSFKEFLLTKN